MDLLSAFKRRPAPPAAPEAADADAVQRARARSRQRLIGAAVLVVAGIIGFPLLFETQPRPIPVDLPIEIPSKDSLPPLAMPSATPPAALPPGVQVAAGPAPARAAVPTSPPAPASAAASVPAAERVITESEADAGREVVTPQPSASAVAAAPPPPKPKPAPPAAAPASAAVPPAALRAADGARAQALLEGRQWAAADAPASPASPAAAARFIVQVGAYAEPAALKEARTKVEKLGLKTYTQVAETPAGPRTRVRVGPFATREEADRAAAKLKAAALPAAVLTL